MKTSSGSRHRGALGQHDAAEAPRGQHGRGVGQVVRAHDVELVVGVSEPVDERVLGERLIDGLA